MAILSDGAAADAETGRIKAELDKEEVERDEARILSNNAGNLAHNLKFRIGHWKERAEAAEAKLAERETYWVDCLTDESRKLHLAMCGQDELRARIAAHAESAPAAKWEADHQREALLRVGLAEEFPWGCDAIEHVAESLVGSRKKVAALKAERDALRAQVAMLRGTLRAVEIGCSTAESEAVARHGENWRSRFIQSALALTDAAKVKETPPPERKHVPCAVRDTPLDAGLDCETCRCDICLARRKDGIF